jgi:hypothetical protein
MVFVVTAHACVQRLPVCLFYHANVPTVLHTGVGGTWDRLLLFKRPDKTFSLKTVPVHVLLSSARSLSTVELAQFYMGRTKNTYKLYILITHLLQTNEMHKIKMDVIVVE